MLNTRAGLLLGLCIIKQINQYMTKDNLIICISWNKNLGRTRELLLRSAGYPVLSAVRQTAARSACQEDAALLVLGHSVPRTEKRSLIDCFRLHSKAPVLSLLRGGEEKIPEATFGVDASDPSEFLRVVRNIVRPTPVA